MPILNAPVDVEDMRIAPGVVAGFLGPMVEIVLVSSRPDHAVYAGAAAQRLAHGLLDTPIVDGGAGLGGEAPVELGALVDEPSLRDEDA